MREEHLMNKRLENYNEINNLIQRKVYGSNKFMKLYEFLIEFRYNYIAPQYFLETLVKSEQKYFSEKMTGIISKGILDENDMYNSQIDLKLEVNNLLINIKMSLDRIVKIAAIFYNGVSPSSTFGHINDDGKSKGFMSYVCQYKSSDKLLELVYTNYMEWIKEAVLPRNQIMHYENLLITFPYNLISDEISISYKTNEGFEFDINDLSNYTEKWFLFIDEIFDIIISTYK
ncbi:hypothetical protein [Empedobacter sp.]|uniref:hypothetical protein n=1 Tax=Empedobacter sp. TaxID=1927715 RepID=UPI0028988A8C|nr:hypothetical protein [Empedobacter sp.]